MDARTIGRQGSLMTWLLGGMLMLLLAGCASTGEEPSKQKPVLKLYVFEPDHPIVTRDDFGEVLPVNTENAIYTLGIWVFDAGNSNLVTYIGLKDVTLSATGTVITMELPDGFSSTNVDVFVLANVTHDNCGQSFDGFSSRDDIEAACLEHSGADDYFGISSLPKGAMPVPNDGLPMSGMLKNAPVSGESPLYNVGPSPGVYSNVKLVRAVSKVRFVFSKSSSNNLPINITRITLKSGLMPKKEYLFLDGVYPEVKCRIDESKGYEGATNLVEDVHEDDIKGNDDPASYAVVSSTGQLYERKIDIGVTEGKLSDLGRFYLRESDKKLECQLVYQMGTDPERTVDFSMEAAGDFTRNHTWIVYGYFVGTGDLVLNTYKVWDWDTVRYPAEVYNW